MPMRGKFYSRKYVDGTDRAFRNVGKKFILRGFTQKKEYSIHNTVKVLNQKTVSVF
jgi:hypothetical protein